MLSKTSYGGFLPGYLDMQKFNHAFNWMLRLHFHLIFLKCITCSKVTVHFTHAHFYQTTLFIFHLNFLIWQHGSNDFIQIILFVLNLESIIVSSLYYVIFIITFVISLSNGFKVGTCYLLPHTLSCSSSFLLLQCNHIYQTRYFNDHFHTVQYSKVLPKPFIPLQPSYFWIITND